MDDLTLWACIYTFVIF